MKSKCCIWVKSKVILRLAPNSLDYQIIALRKASYNESSMYYNDQYKNFPFQQGIDLNISMNNTKRYQILDINSCILLGWTKEFCMINVHIMGNVIVSLLLSKNFIFTYLNHPKPNIYFMLALNFCIMHLFEFYVLIGNMKNDERNKVLVCD
jgi:hypothetical protein